MSGNLSNTRLVALDVDGVLTDGRFYLSDDGRETKAFSTQDGFGIRRLQNAGVHVAIISGRESAAVTMRMQELGVQHVFLGCKDKVAVFDSLIAELGIEAADSVYVGDDVPDLQLLQKVGTPIAVANAVQEVKDFCEISTRASGGFGAVREVCDMVLAALPD